MSPLEYEGTWQELAAHATEFGDRRLRLIVLDSPPVDPAFTPIEHHLAALAARVDPVEWDKLPADLSDRLDDYIYGPRPE
jgi:hypothetical protein